MSYDADAEAPIIQLLAKKHFDQLPTLDAKLYAHHLSRASHHGTRAVLRSVSPESEAIYDLVIAIHKALGEPTTVEEYQSKIDLPGRAVVEYLEYASQFLGNLGNYKSFGDKKFVPRLNEGEFETVAKAAGAEALFEKVRVALYDTSKPLLGWPEDSHVSAYYPDSDVRKADIEAINAALAERGIMPENTRVKQTDTGFVVLVASAVKENTTDYYPDSFEVDGKQVQVQFGDHSAEFERIVRHLELALPHVANDTQHKFISHYIEAFKTGSMNAHKKSQIEWVKDTQPYVESNIGFIETYRDPSGVRGEWEGLVAMVNQDRTAKFSTLVASATSLIPYLPWSHLYEKDTFTPPDFTSLEVLTFAGGGIPAGINIPNYDDVRLHYGFKNVSLGNVMQANPKNPSKPEVITFVSEHLQDTYRKWRDDAFEVQVGLHELLGHGTGKLLQETKPGEFNFDKDAHPEIKTWYGPNDTWGSLFSQVSGSFEECRAELVALYLILKKPTEVLPIFDIEAEHHHTVKVVATLLMARAGIVGLELWDPESRKWGQPHMQARFGIFKTLHKAGVVHLKHTKDDYDDLELELDELKLDVAVEALGDFLAKLHIYKSTGNVKEGVAYYLDVTGVTPEYARYRDVVLKKKLPRRQLIQANTVLKDGVVEVVEYPESTVGMIQSFVDRAV